ncbi:MAG: LPS export ABC transporter permease LptF [Desulfobacteraceae bacterium]|nr:LPS export ABC transporter permease LptF [Desulfobacteraceae bacterium]MCF8095527.1 LPS export ABC transporter permease LptF [Desulfobacteraceae bacterium]
MKINTIVSRFILKEMIPPFLINMGFFMFVFLMREILEITDMIVNYQVSLGIFLLMIIYSMPYFLVYIIPMSVMMSVLLTFLRMSADNEILALKSAGVSLYHMLAPVMVFAVAGFAVTVFMAAYGMPWGKFSYERLSMEVVQSNFNIGLKEHQFIDSFEGVMMYVNEVDAKDRSMQGVFIEDGRTTGPARTVVAPEGYLFEGDKPHTFVIRLYNGIVSQSEPREKSSHATRFNTYDIRLDLQSAVSAAKSGSRDEKEMGIGELRSYLEKQENRNEKFYYSVHMEFHRKFSIPFACIALAVLAMPLGVRSFSAKKSAGLGMGLICFLLYYLILSGGMVLGEAVRYHPAPLLWLPNFIMGGAGVYLLVKAAKDSPVVFFSVFSKSRRVAGRPGQTKTGAGCADGANSRGDSSRS